MSNFIEELVEKQNTYRSLLENNEAQTRWLLIDDFILRVLGYAREDVICEYKIGLEGHLGKYNALDYCVCREKIPYLLIEAKSLGLNLYEHITQLKLYFDNVYSHFNYQSNELIGVLTDGDLFLFFTADMEKKTMSVQPFFTLRLSSAEQEEIDRLGTFMKCAEVKEDVLIFDEEFEKDTFYRIDRIEEVLNYFRYKGELVSLSKVRIMGKTTNISSFRTLYKKLLTEINILNPESLYTLCCKEVSERDESVLRNMKFSFTKKNDTDLAIKTTKGIIYAHIPDSESSIIHRITYVLKESHFGLFNVSVALH